jgi:precorrin-3B synthase
VADCADELGDGRVHLTSRGNLQLRGLSRTGPLVGRLTAAGLLPSVTHERVRNVLASPLSGIATGPAARGWRSPEVRGLAAELDRGLCARPALAGLPGRFLFALDDGRGDVAGEEPDLCWRAVSTSAGVLLVAGVAVAEVAAADAVRVLLDAAEAFLALRAGGAAWRAAELPGAPARLAAALGLPPCPEGHLHDTSRPGGGLHDIPAPAPAAVPGAVRRDDGGVALVVAPLLGELTADQVRLLADAAGTPRADAGSTQRAGAAGGPRADAAGGPRADAARGSRAGPATGDGAATAAPTWVIVTAWRTVVLPDPRVPAAELAAAGLVVAPGPAAGVSACAGRPGCAKALADVRADVRAALGRVPGGRAAAGRTHVSGCARRCGAPRGPHVDAVALDGGGYLVDGVPYPGLTPAALDGGGHLPDGVPLAGPAR